MDQKRFLLFIVLSMGILIGWNALVMPRFLPPPRKPGAAAKNEPDKKAGQDDTDRDKKKGAADPSLVAGPGKDDDEKHPPAEKPDGAADDEKPAAAADKADAGEHQDPKKPGVVAKIPQFPDTNVELGAGDIATGFCQRVTLSSRGAAVKQIELTDPRYVKLEKNRNKVHPPLVIVGDGDIKPSTLELQIPQLRTEPNLNDLNWELVETSPAEGPLSVAIFRLTLEDLEVTKRYELPMIALKNGIRDEAPAYSMKVDLTFRNLGREPRIINYILQGPTGLPLENIENTQKFRDVVVGFESAPNSITNELMAAKTVASGKGEEWKKPMIYIGVDVQFFAALICPVPDQLETPYTKSVKQELIGPNREEKSEISVQLTSIDLQLAAAGAADGEDSAAHEYRLFAGPKRDDVLPVGAERVLDYGTALGLFRIDWISRPMVTLLKVFYGVFGSWGFAVICLTIVVRGAMFPISIRTARSAAKMQALKPQLEALKQKHANDKEKMTRATMELYGKHGVNPLKGCLPVFLQLPIFIGLYQALNHAVDLRMASFLWIDNLAAPDSLFRMPFAIPFLGHEFNLLPLVTTGLFYLQQKMFMPPPSNEQEAMQQKTMNFMMLFMGVMFYRVPAGLCVYFIASSLWGMAERKLLPKAMPGAAVETPPADSSQGRRKPPDSDDGDKNGGGGLWSMLLKAAEKETSARRASNKGRK